MINEFGERLGSHLEILQLPSHSKGPRKIKDKINFKVIEVVPEELVSFSTPSFVTILSLSGSRGREEDHCTPA